MIYISDQCDLHEPSFDVLFVTNSNISSRPSREALCLNLIVFCLQVKKVAIAFDPFRKLSKHTQAALLKHNTAIIISLYAGVFTETCKQGFDQVSLF